MVRAFNFLVLPQGGWPEVPLLDLRGFSTILFGMGFERAFTSLCESTYGWDFSAILPDLYEGTFNHRGYSGHITGQDALRGFATFLSAQLPDIPPEYAVPLVNGLKADGYRYADRKLIEIEQNVDSNASPEVTGLPDKKLLLKDIDARLKASELVTVVFIDLDNFKSVNDKLGHAEGDKCLTDVVRNIAAAIKFKGRLYRVGGDEFCVLLANFSLTEATATAERLRTRIDNLLPFGGSVKVTTSIGLADSDAAGLTTAEKLYDAADNAMYVAKYTTKNRVCTWPPNPQDAALADANRSAGH